MDGLEEGFDGLEQGKEPASRQSQSPALIIRLLRHLRQLGDRRPKDNHPGISLVFPGYFPGISKENHPGIFSSKSLVGADVSGPLYYDINLEGREALMCQHVSQKEWIYPKRVTF